MRDQQIISKRIETMNYNYKDLDALNQELARIWPDWSAVKVLGKRLNIGW